MKRKRAGRATKRALTRALADATRTIRALRRTLALFEHRLARYVEAEEQRQQDKETDWAAYDRCADAVTANERALFEASPAFKRYQQWRQTGATVRTGDWRAP